MINTLPTIRSYGNYSSSNYGAHTLQVSISTLTLYFSYKTVVAFETLGQLVCSTNVWTPTTGKHLNWIEVNKKARVPFKDFETALAKVLKKHKLN